MKTSIRKKKENGENVKIAFTMILIEFNGERYHRVIFRVNAKAVLCHPLFFLMRRVVMFEDVCLIRYCERFKGKWVFLEKKIEMFRKNSVLSDEKGSINSLSGLKVLLLSCAIVTIL